MVKLSVLFGLSVGLASCVRSDSVYCDNGDVCPEGTQCDDLNGGCIVQIQRDECAGDADGTSCMWDGTSGVCVNAVCLGHSCGDGRKSGPESCDPTAQVAGDIETTCTQLGYYQGSTVTCAADCTWDKTPCAEFCGDGMINGSELCEGDMVPGGACTEFGYDRGALTCGGCSLSFQDCELVGWRQLPLPGQPEDAIAIGPDVVVALSGPHLAARDSATGWVGLGTFAIGDSRPAGWAIAGNGPNDLVVGGNLIPAKVPESHNGYVARYDGSTWTSMRTFPAPVDAVWASGAHVFVHEDQTLHHFNGSTWSSQALPGSAFGSSISGTSPSDVWVATGTKLYHGGAGQTFTEVVVPTAGEVTGVYAFAPGSVAVVVYDVADVRAILYVRENNTWRAAPYPVQGTRYGDIYAASGTDIYVALMNDALNGPAFIAHHDGSTWQPLSIANTNAFLPSALAGSVAAGVIAFDNQHSAAFHYPGSAWVETPPPGSAPLWGVRHDELYTTLPISRAFVYGFDGHQWQLQGARGVVDGSSETVVYALDPDAFGNYDSPTLWRRTGPFTWTSTAMPVTGGNYGSWFGVLGADDMFVSQISVGTVHYRHWNGSVVRDTNLPDSGEFGTAHAIECVVGAGCYSGAPEGLYHTPGAHDGWTQVAAVAIGGVSTIYIADPTHVFAGGTLGRIAHLVGTTWTTKQLPTTARVSAISGSSANDVFAVTASASNEHQLYHWDGTAWTRVRTPLPAFGSGVDQLWVGRRTSYLGGQSALTGGSRHFHALVRTEPW